jgi:hypothetical protein
MKALDWQRFFAGQNALHGKTVFSVAELANVAQTTLHALNTELGRLVKRGLITRYAQGRYGLNQGVTPESIVQEIDPGAYITGFYALFRHQLVTQAPVEITCLTNRRHNRKLERATPAGRLRFIHVPAALYLKPADQVLVNPQQALCDFVWLCLRDGVEPRSLVTFRNCAALGRRRLNETLRRYPESVQNTVAGIVDFTANAPSPCRA